MPAIILGMFVLMISIPMLIIADSADNKQAMLRKQQKQDFTLECIKIKSAEECKTLLENLN